MNVTRNVSAVLWQLLLGQGNDGWSASSRHTTTQLLLFGELLLTRHMGQPPRLLQDFAAVATDNKQSPGVTCSSWEAAVACWHPKRLGRTWLYAISLSSRM